LGQYDIDPDLVYGFMQALRGTFVMEEEAQA
jgi:hypothetical protein